MVTHTLATAGTLFTTLLIFTGHTAAQTAPKLTTLYTFASAPSDGKHPTAGVGWSAIPKQVGAREQNRQLPTPTRNMTARDNSSERYPMDHIDGVQGHGAFLRQGRERPALSGSSS
jgi:hypothetical protein